MSLSLSFLGAAGTVTGSKYLLDDSRHKLLVDCGLFQGFKALRLRNRARFAVDPRGIEAVLLTHAHLDHSGYLPLLAKNGFRGPIYSSEPTAELCGILLPDSGHLQEREAELANRMGYTRHKPALPLYTEDDARKVQRQFRTMPFETSKQLGMGAAMRLRRAGHILGAASIEVMWAGATVLFSGDLGRYNDATMLDPEPIERADFLLVESTYGNRRHGDKDPEDAMADAINRSIKAGGTVIIPAFAVGRVQSLLYHLGKLKESGRLPSILPVFLDSPMALDASDIFCRHADDHKIPQDRCRSLCANTHYVRDSRESKDLTANPMPKVIISASGMATGGRVLHHIRHYAPDPKNTILFAGFQAGGTRGAAMVAGAQTVKMFGEYVPVRAKVENLEMLSAHADCDELMRWLKTAKTPPKTTFVTHGEPQAADALRHRIEEELGWNCVVPDQDQVAELA
ncbi:MAG: MBL fold metallo-hydrolase [Proteobacteria bacterium]|nr:MBL fold metallo-hydrolase [Pseudomonadota bacterium]